MVALLSLRLLGDRVRVFISMACWLRHAVALGSFWLVTFLACLGVPQCGLTLPHGLRTFGGRSSPAWVCLSVGLHFRMA